MTERYQLAQDRIWQKKMLGYNLFLKGLTIGKVSFEEAAKVQSILVDYVAESYWNRFINKEETVRVILDLNNRMRTALTVHEGLVLEECEKRNNLIILRTDTFGGETRGLLEERNLMFATGVATGCLICVVYDDYKIGASHRNTYRETEYIRVIAETLDRRQDIKVDYNTVVTPDILSRVVRQTVNEAINQFSNLPVKGIPLTRVTVTLGGIDLLASQRLSEVTTEAMQVLKRHPIINDGSGDKNVSIDDRFLGREIGFIWGKRTGFKLGTYKIT